MNRKRRRLTLIGTAVATAALATGLILFALRGNMVFFYGPAELAQSGIGPGTRLRIGGLVKPGTVARSQGNVMSFVITDNVKDVKVTFDGILPDLFREGQGVLAEGSLDGSGTFLADNVLAKHDETYMPREVADALKKQGVWRGGSQPSSVAGAESAETAR